MTDDPNGAPPEPTIEAVEDLDDGWGTASEKPPAQQEAEPAKQEAEPAKQEATQAPQEAATAQEEVTQEPPTAQEEVTQEPPTAQEEVAPTKQPTWPAPQPEAGVPIRLYGRTDVGQIREHNEDNFVIADLTAKTRALQEIGHVAAIGKYGVLLGVCDGMGGAAAGEVASQLAVDIIFQTMSAGDPPATRDDLAHRLNDALEAAADRIFKEANADRARRGMGTTATISALVDDHLFLAEVGDSRGYILRGDRLVQVTRDQSLVNQLIEAGQLTEAEAETFEHNNIILQALGTAENVQVDITYVELRQGDTLLLCSDGLSGMVRFEEIREVLCKVDDLQEVCRILIEKANLAGGHDNITVVVAKFEGDWLQPPSPDDDLRYKKYSLPEAPIPQGEGVSPLGDTARDLAAPPGWQWQALPEAPEGSPPGLGPGKSKLAHTVVGAQMSPAARAAIAAAGAKQDRPFDDGEPILIPTSSAPAWMVGGVVFTALALALLAGYYLFR